MKSFLKQYFGLFGALALASGSLFAFNISTSIDNALQVIKTIWVTSDGTTTNPPFITMDGSGRYMSIGTTASGSTVTVSGSVHGYLTNTYGVTSHIILDNGNALGLPFVGQYASGASGMMIAGIETANQAVGMINQNTNNTAATIVQVTKSIAQIVYCRTIGCNNNADKNGIEIDGSGTVIHGYASNKNDYNTLWKSSNNTELMKIQNDGEFKQTRGEYTIENTNDLQPYAGGYKFAGARWRSGSFALASGLSFDLMAGVLAAPSDPFPVFALKYMIGDQPYSQMLFEPDDVIFNMNSGTGPAGTTFSFGITKDGSQFIDDTDNPNNVSTQRVNSSGNIVTSILNNGRVGINTNNPGNALQINPDNMNIAHNDLGLRFSMGSGHSGEVLGLNNNGDVVMLGNVGSFGGSGGGTNYRTESGSNLYPTTLSNSIGIGTTTPSETFDLSGTLLTTFMNQYGNFGLVGNTTIFGGMPGAGAYVTSGGELLFAGVDHDGNKLSAEFAYNSGGVESQFISVSQDGPAMIRQSTLPVLHRNAFNITSTGTFSSIASNLIGPMAFIWQIDGGSELMRLSNDGYFGIGVVNPLYTLDVGGMARIGTIPIGSSTDNILVESGGVIRKISSSSLGGGMKSATLVLGSTELAVINGGGGTTIACPSSASNYIELLNTTFEYDYNTTPYAGSAASIFVFYVGSTETSSPNLTYSNVGILGNTDRIYKISGRSNGMVLTGPSNCLKMTGGTPLTGGDGTLRIKVLYKEETFGQ